MDNLIRITPNKEKAASILKMVDITLEMIKEVDIKKFPSNLLKEYYDVLRELISIILLLDGYKTYGEEAHKISIEYLSSNYKQFSSYEISLINDLRVTRNKVAYDGFFIKTDYLERKLKEINSLIIKLQTIIKDKL